jgi:hypothetical protein
MRLGGRRDDLERLVVDHRKSRPQHLVALDDVVERLGQGIYIEVTSQTHSGRNIVKGIVRHQLVEEPQPPLRK